MELSKREQKELEYINKWEQDYINDKQNSLLAGVQKKVKMPFHINLDDNIKYYKVKGAIQDALLGAIEITQDVAKYTYIQNKTVKEFRARGVACYEDLYKVEAYEIERIARKAIMSNKLLCFSSGFGAGLGEYAMTLAEIPAFTLLTFRVMQQIADCYGFDPEDAQEKIFMFKLLSFGTALNPTGKLKVNYELSALRTAIKRKTFKKLQEEGGEYTLILAAREAGKNVGMNITKKKLLQGLPIIGAGFGGCFNYAIIGRVAFVANMQYKKRYLEDKLEATCEILCENP